MKRLPLILAALLALPAAGGELSLGLSLAGTGMDTGRQNQHIAFSTKRWHLQAVHEGERGDRSAAWLVTGARQWVGLQDAAVQPIARLGVAAYLEGAPRGGCRVGYFLGVALRWGALELFREHVSSAGVCRPNPGMDATGLRFSTPL